MRPLIFEFKETPTGETLDYSLIEYDNILNLSVNKVSREPAINSINLATTTSTRNNQESSDSDKDGINIMMDTVTHTFNQTESSDDDKGGAIAIANLMDTTTLTKSTETSDQDHKNNDFNSYSQN